MSIAFESPSQRRQVSDAYFTPMTAPNTFLTTNSSNPTVISNRDGYNSKAMNSNNNNNDTENCATPFFTAPISPMIHQDFLNAINHRHSSQPAVFTPTMENKPSVTFASGGSIADRRRAAKQQALSNHTPPPLHTNNPIPPTSPAKLLPIHPEQLMKHISQQSTLVLDVRSFVQFSHARICQSINISIPNTILKRPTFTMEKVYEATAEVDCPRMKQWFLCEMVVFYDQSSMVAQEQSAISYLANKMIRADFSGSLYYLQGGFDAFQPLYPDQCLLTSPSSTNNTQSTNSLPFLRNKIANGSKTPSLNLGSLPPNGPPMNLGPYTAPMPHFENQVFNPFFSNIRQNMELSDGPIKERFPIRLPCHCHPILLDDANHSLVIEMDSLDPMPRIVAGAILETNQQGKHVYRAPRWLQKTMVDYNSLELNTVHLAELYEKLERTEQRRLQNIMYFHSKNTNTDPLEYPLSIVAGIEMGALNRYTNIWPFEYSRVKIQHIPRGSTGYINASFIQYYQQMTKSPTSSTSSLDSNNNNNNNNTTSGSRSSSVSTQSLSSLSSSSSSSKETLFSPLSSLSAHSSPSTSSSSSSSSNGKNTPPQSQTSNESQTSSSQVNPSCLKMMKSSHWYEQPYRRYISTQGPLPSTFDDFWQVVWEQNSRVVVMLTKEEEMNKIKCHRYWPSQMNQAIQYGTTRLTLVGEMEHTVEASDWKEDIIYEREFMMEKDGEPSRRMTQLHYTGWMDYGVPDNPLGTLQLVQLADQSQRRYESANQHIIIGPMVIHCSAGCGRSGAFCAIDTVLRRLTLSNQDAEHLLQNTDALWDIIFKFREQRLSMVQTLRQFVFCYEVVWWWFLGYGQQQQTHDGMEF